MRAGLYARVSREEQAEGYSIDEQLDAMRRFCRDKGWSIAAEYVEPGHSGTVRDRPAFVEALTDCESGQIDILLTHQLDRFYRNLQLQLETMGQLGKWGVGYLSVTEQIDYSEPQGMLFLQMLGAFNEYYVANLRREVRKGKRGRAKKGLTNASTIPHGYRRDKIAEGHWREPEPDAEAAAAVVLAFETYAQGHLSDTDTAGMLNRAGYPPSGRARSGLWTREGVRYMLCNPFYVGQVRHGDHVYAGQHEPLISQELFDQVQAVRAKRRLNKGGQKRAYRVYLLRRLAVCSECGLHLVAQTSTSPGRQPIQQYICPARRRSIDCRSPKHMTRGDALNEQISKIVKRLRLPDDWRDRLEELANHKKERERIEGKRRYLEGKLRRMRDLFIDGDISKQEYSQRKAELVARLDDLQVAEVLDIEQAGQTLEHLAEFWNGAPLQLRAEMLQTIFEEVRVDVTAGRVVCMKPYPPFVPLFRLDGLEERENGYFYPREGKDQQETRSES